MDGLKYIQEMASQGVTELRIDLQAADGTRAYETFSSFSLSNNTNYTLHLGPTSSSLNIKVGDVLEIHNGQPFSTQDRDIDNASFNCATKSYGAWWYNNCYKSNLNGKYLTPGTYNDWKGINYLSFNKTSLKRTKMMFRRGK